jgi:hypothetical protein
MGQKGEKQRKTAITKGKKLPKLARRKAKFE